MHPPHGGHHTMMFLGPLTGLLLLALIGFAVFMLIKRGRLGPVRWAPQGVAAGPTRRHAHAPEEEALHTLRMRLANGDITPEEYLERSSVLRPTPPSGREA